MTIEAIFPDWEVPPNIKAIQTTRHSKNVIKYINKIDLNFDFLKQIHGKTAIELPCKQVPADAAFSYAKNTICAVRTADCLPILLTNESGSFVAAIHAGWRGLCAGVIEKTIKTIKTNSQITAWLGPCISQANFEVGAEVYDQFLEMDKNTLSAFQKYENKYKLSLALASQIKLEKLKIKKIYGNSITQNYCTYDDIDNFYSYRRGRDMGRMVTLVWIQEENF